MSLRANVRYDGFAKRPRLFSFFFFPVGQNKRHNPVNGPGGARPPTPPPPPPPYPPLSPPLAVNDALTRNLGGGPGRGCRSLPHQVDELLVFQRFLMPRLGHGGSVVGPPRRRGAQGQHCGGERLGKSCQLFGGASTKCGRQEASWRNLALAGVGIKNKKSWASNALEKKKLSAAYNQGEINPKFGPPPAKKKSWKGIPWRQRF